MQRERERKFWSSVEGCSQATMTPQTVSGRKTPRTHLASAGVVHPIGQMQ